MTNEIKNINDLIFSDAVKNKLEMIQKKKSGFYLFYSSETGTGKTTVANIIAKEVSKSTSNDNSESYHYFDCTDIDESKLFKKIDSILKTHSLNGSNRVVILDEADKLNASSKKKIASIYNKLYKHNQLDKVLIILIANSINSFDKSLISRCSGVCFSNQETEQQLFEYFEKQIDNSEFKNTLEAKKTLTVLKALLNRTADVRKATDYVNDFLNSGLYDAMPLVVETK